MTESPQHSFGWNLMTDTEENDQQKSERRKHIFGVESLDIESSYLKMLHVLFPKQCSAAYRVKMYDGMVQH